MIVPNLSDDKQNLRGVQNDSQVFLETPPPYTPASGASSSSTPLPLSPRPKCAPPDILPCNFRVDRRKNSSLRATYVIDTELAVPDAMLPPLRSCEQRKNLDIDCDNGSIKAEIWIVPRERKEGDPKQCPASLNINGHNGSVVVRVNAEEGSPFNLKITAHNGGVTVALPRSFSGPLTTHTKNGWASFSPALAPHVTTFSDVKSTRKCFVGDFASSGFGRDEWEGSSLQVDTHNGKVKLLWVDEAENQRERVGFWDKLFGVSRV